MRNRLIAWLLTLILALTPACLALAETVTQSAGMADKLRRQLAAGTGFSGTLTLTSAAVEGREAEAFVTTDPLVLGLRYIQVREDALQSIQAERRLELTLMPDDAADAQASIALRDARVFLSGTLFGEGWFQLGSGVESLARQDAAGVLSQGAAPGLYGFLLPMLTQPASTHADELDESLATYATKVDLWLEGYRQGATIGELDDGTATMDVSYIVPPAAIKAQLKQLVLDALADQVLLLRLRELLTDDEIAQYLDPALQSHYFAAIDALPLEGDLTLTRVCSLKGGTLKLSISLPMYDAQAGLMTLRYERVAPLGDAPGSHSIRLETEALTLAVDATEYQTMTGTTVFQGTLARLPHGEDSYQVSDGTSASLLATPVGCAFTLTYGASTAKTADNKDQDSYQVKLSLAPDAAALTALGAAEDAACLDFPAFDLEGSLSFTSGRALNTSTALLLEATLSGETLPQVVTLTLEGKTVSPWTPAVLNEVDATDVADMSADEQGAWLLGAGLKALALITPHIQLPTAADAPAETAAPADGAADAPADTEPAATDAP